MPKRSRLTHAELKTLSAARGKRFHGQYFSLLSIPQAGNTSPRAACVVSKKVSARAVVRNRVKRRFRSALASLFSRLPSGAAFIFTAKPVASGASYQEILTDVTRLVGQVAQGRA